jgi:Fe-Mn family superoxide dismutase
MNIIENRIKAINEQLLTIDNEKNKTLFLTEMKKIGIEKLPYAYTALKQFIDSETMSYHYNKHYKGYVNKLNKALSKKDYGDVELEDIIKRIGKYNKTIRNNAGGAFNHALFWKMLSPKEQECSGPILKKINSSFGNLKEFKNKFESVAQNRFGSGWVWLVLTKRNTLKIISTPNQDNPLMNVIQNGGYPLLGLDLWEHSYYLKYRNKRDEYIKNFWKCVNWEFVNELFKMKTKTSINENIKLKRILSEGISERCSRSDVQFYRGLFNTNEYVKKIYRFGIERILKEVYPNHFYKKNEYGENEMSGIYDFEQKGRSVINKMNTNYEVFCVLLNDINLVMEKLGRPQISFKNKNVGEQIGEAKKLITILDEFKTRIFSLSSGTFQNIMLTLGSTNSFGELTEIKVVEILKKEYGDENVTKIGKLGSSVDALEGIDCEVKVDGVIKTAQIKPYGSFDLVGGFYTMLDTGQVKPYYTDWMIFSKKNKDAMIFENKDIKIIKGNYVIPEINLIKHIY